MVAGNQGGDAEIQEPSAPHSKSHLPQTTNILSLGLMESTKTVAKQNHSSSLSFSGLLLSIWTLCTVSSSLFSQEKTSMGLSSLCLCFLLSLSQQESSGPDGW